ncbi:MAG: hypothetical protein AAFP87_08060 [Pseudomonadota bacterium]
MASLAAPMATATPLLTCVQNQLAELGHDPGPADGQPGPATAAAAALHQDGGETLPPLRTDTAQIWCRALGMTAPALQAHWPARQDDLIWVPDDLRNGPGFAILENARDAARAFYLERYGHQIAGDFAILGGDDPRALEQAALARRKTTGRSTRDMFRTPMQCGSQRAPRARAYRDMAMLCWAAPPAYDAGWRAANQVWWARIVVHEYLHGIQNELLGGDFRRRLPSGQRALGPMWLVEGAAEVFEEEYFALHSRFNEYSIGTHTRRARESIKRLADMHQRVVGRDYDVAQFAAHLLGERFGRKALIDYFGALQTSDSWDAAFRKTFGMSLDAFEQEFETMRSNLVLSYTFAKGLE